MIKYILGALVAAVLWAVVIVFQLPIWIGIAATTLIILVLIAIVAVRHLKAAKAAGDIEKALAAQASAEAQGARPDLQEEVQAMQAEFTKAIAALKTSKLARGRGGKEALSVLPWYMIIGPPGSGKSTALRNSGIKFPYLSSRGGGVKGVGGTRNCEWWLTNEAVILDTAGRYTTEDEDRDEWFSFLDMLKRNRAKKPVNGLIVAVSVGDIIGIDEEETVQLAQRLRERVDEVMERLKMIVPVYLMFTKCDLLAGFVDIFGDLAKSERGQIWGFTVPVMEKGEDLGEVFREKFDEMAEVVEQRSIQRVGDERHPETRERIYRFPQQFEGLKDNIAAMVQALFAENVYQDTPVMRGVYFTSGTQEGSPIDRVMNAMADAFGIRRSLPSNSKPAVEARSYFLRDVFGNVIFPDQDLAVVSTAENQRLKQMQYAYAGGALLVAVLILLFPTIAFFKNRALIQDTRDIFQAQLNSAENTSTASIAVEDLRVLRSRIDELRKNEEDGPPTGMRFGMYRGGVLFEPLSKFYGAAVRRTFVEPVLQQDFKDLSAFGRKYEGDESEKPDEREYARYFSLLKLNLFLTGPRTEAEPAIGEAERAWIVANVVSRWANRSGFAESAERQRLLGEHLDLYVNLLAQNPSLAFTRNDKVISDARVALSRLPFDQLLLNQIIADVGGDFNLKLSSMLGGTTSNIKSKGLIRGAFTRKGWDALVRDRLESPLQNADLWVLGKDTKNSTDAEIDKLLNSLESRYFEQYITEWQTFLDSIDVARPGSSAEVLAALEELTRGKPPPLARLFQAVGYNSKLPTKKSTDDVGEDLIKTLKDKIQKSSNRNRQIVDVGSKFLPAPEESGEIQYTALHVQAAFDTLVKFGVPPPPPSPESPPESVQLDLYQEQLVFVRDALRQFLENPSEGKALNSRLATARVQVQALVNGQEDPNIRPVLGKLLMPPLEASSSLANREAGTAINQSWCSEIVDAFKRNLANRYPFNRNGHDASLADVGEFYRPTSGTVWGFFDTSLKEDVRRAGDKFQFIKKLGSTPLQPSLLTFLKRSYDISTSMFVPNGSEPVMKFSISIRPSPALSSITFSVDGQEVVYKNEPERWTKFSWPGDGKKSGAQIKVRNPRGQLEELERDGEWGLFRLMEEGAAQMDKGARVFSMKWKMPSTNAEVVIDFKPERTATPFFGTSPSPGTGMLQPFRVAGVAPPKTIGKGSGCSE
ncbi:type VI secretion system membrane subunit TssM [Hyalangium rubrum]|uniref:Type VI secretion system membrane subunit TssM n=1 Tax=Hyalangium rubrum TaxID=3103134 RepID=A0ABU5HDI3_9BACT|nr:type VI secretion system membrane subunit TssM [Hyalangium sp. s54d21]MDY7230939.1 type VI secretion system membrane subunit TssM [Hyalangium sp. s54d21]